jgi:LDH2 family malate/lactate/ureidoglycolate dehydrogenase
MSCGGLTPAYRVGELRGFATALFGRAGLDADKADTVAAILVEGDLLGHSTHGLALAAPYLAALDAGGMTRKGDPVVVSDRGGAVCWDGRRLPGPWLVVRAIEQALARVPEQGVAAVAIRESHYIGCLAAYLERATSKGCMILLICSDPSEASIAPYEGVQALFTPGPIAVGIPTHGDTILIDMSASIMTNGTTARLHREGRRFPGNWAMTASGEPTADPGVLFAEPRGTLLPTGGREYGHKGFNLVLMIEALSQGLAGHGRADRAGRLGVPPGHGPGRVRRRRPFRAPDRLHRNRPPQQSAGCGRWGRVCRASRVSHTGARPAPPASISIPGSWMRWRRVPSGSRSSRPHPRTD